MLKTRDSRIPLALQKGLPITAFVLAVLSLALSIGVTAQWQMCNTFSSQAALNYHEASRVLGIILIVWSVLWCVFMGWCIRNSAYLWMQPAFVFSKVAYDVEDRHPGILSKEGTSLDISATRLNDKIINESDELFHLMNR